MLHLNIITTLILYIHRKEFYKYEQCSHRNIQVNLLDPIRFLLVLLEYRTES